MISTITLNLKYINIKKTIFHLFSVPYDSVLENIMKENKFKVSKP